VWSLRALVPVSKETVAVGRFLQPHILFQLIDGAPHTVCHLYCL